jgi:hypothetical protein
VGVTDFALRLRSLRRSPSRIGAGGVVARLAATDGLLLFVLATYGSLLLLLLATRTGRAPDTWLAVLAGHDVAHGLPGVDHLTALSAGVRWVDQQWLSQLAFWAIYRLGGLSLIVLAGALAAGSGVIAAAAAARRRGAGMRTTVWAAVALMPVYLQPSMIARSQSLVYPLFVACVWLLVGDSLRPSRRVLLTLPLLALWANLHGSVLLGAALVSAHGVLIVRRRRLGAALAIGAWVCVFASPYATELPHYYRSTILNRSFGLLTEWEPTSLSLLTVPFFFVLFGGFYLLGRSKGRVTRTETTIVLLTSIAALLAVRNVVWFALAALVILPHAAMPLVRGDLEPRSQHNRLCAAAAALMFGMSLVAFAVIGVTTFPVGGAAAATSAARASDKPVFASEKTADWLLATEPALRGRVAFDARIELLPPALFEKLVLLKINASGWSRFTRRYDTFVLDTDGYGPLAEKLVGAGWKQRYQGGGLVVITRP